MVNIKFTGFDWDSGNQKKCQKHGLTLAEIEDLFTSEEIYVAPDIKHSQSENRYLAIGISQNDRGVFVAFTLRVKGGDILVRPISARYMHKKERIKYEQEITRNENR